MARDDYDDQRQQQVGYGGGDVGEAHYDFVGEPAEVARRQAERYAHEHPQREADGGEGERYARAVYDAGQHIAAEGVRAEYVFGAAAAYVGEIGLFVSGALPIPERRGGAVAQVLHVGLAGGDCVGE